MGQIIRWNCNIRDFGVHGNVPIPIQSVVTLLRGLLNPSRELIPQNSLIDSYPPHQSHLYPSCLSFSSTSLSSLQNTKSIHCALSVHAMIMSCHQVQHTPSTAYTKFSLHWVQHTSSTMCTESSIPQVQHTPSTAYNKYSVHQVQHTPSIVYTKNTIHQVWLTPCTAYTEYSIHWVQHTPSTAYTEDGIHPRLFVFPSFSWLQGDPWMQLQLPACLHIRSTTIG
jgi:hypothetical protein